LEQTDGLGTRWSARIDAGHPTQPLVRERDCTLQVSRRSPQPKFRPRARRRPRARIEREKLSAEQNCQLIYNAESLGTVEYCRRQWEAVGAPAASKEMLVRIVAMLTKLVERFDP
jgi:hypothetical protein